PAVLTISDGPLYDYGTVANTTTVDHVFTINNSGGVSSTGMTGGGISAPLTFKGGTYPGTGGTCGATLAGGSSCTMVVTFAPSGTGSTSQTLAVNYTDGVAAQTSQRNITGTAANPASITISDGPTYDYGTQPNGSSTDHAFTLTNSGG